MVNQHDVWMCTECGYTAAKRFIGDICPRCGLTYWRCRVCSFTTIDAFPPDVCPECHAKCEFSNITCYVPGLREADTVNPDF
jgi:rubrerythrin